MQGVVAWLVTPLTGRSTWRRWAHLIMGGALLMPYVILGSLVADWVRGGRSPILSSPDTAVVVALCLPAVAATALVVPAIRTVEGAAARELLGARAAALTPGSARSWSARWRSAGWFALHLMVGGVISALTLSMLPLAAMLLAAPFVEVASLPGGIWEATWAPAAGVGVLVGLVYLVSATGALLARLAPVLLGPSPAERLADLERQAGQLAERNRLARELHDSVGHALANTTMQASAAGRVIESDPEFARQALASIADAGRAALGELDHVLGLLREESSDRSPQRTLADLSDLLSRTRAAGLAVDEDVTGDIDQVAPAVSREAYRIVQEGLTNALRHSGRVHVALRLAIGPERLELEMTNPLGGVFDGEDRRTDESEDSKNDERGGRGLHGMRERVAILRGEMSAAPDGGQWRVAVRLPMKARS